MPLVKRDDDPEDTLDELLQDKARIEELPSNDDDAYEDVESDNSGIPFPGRPSKAERRREESLPPWLQAATLNLFHDELQTTTSEAQTKVTADCLPLLTGRDTQGLPLNSHGLPHLRREQHVNFLHSQLGPFPAPYVAIDASRPWFFYWTMAGLSILGEDVRQFRDRLMETVRPLQNKTGGFGGGHGQYSHCAGSYATVLALATIGGLDMIDRKAMWEWLGTVKQADGGFRMAVGAEEDIRGAYCAMTIITLLNLPLDLPPDAPARKADLTTFTDRLGEWVGRCQSYEGGIGGAPTNEAHGAYAFCALACLSILDAPHVSIPKYLDAPALLSWLAARQTQPEGGFQGRQEKLVDACYAHWVGGCWDLIQAAVAPAASNGMNADVWNRAALIRYLLTCCQQPGKKGGMRDKPSTRPDAYHTCYSLAGLSHAQNHYQYDKAAPTRDGEKGRLTAAFNWTAEKATETELQGWRIEREDVVEFVHPVFVLPMGVVEECRGLFEGVGILEGAVIPRVVGENAMSCDAGLDGV
ncbi:CAAX farnesyltransferase (FTase) subunit beta [Saxophila tyrrhenica]|uniref:Protein farnesyltransferase subunit beta n=1 Tax=Saxophila tyrrhenica TaxID=1690608 RepID=A0AAV9PMQ3_9PEZI|nr:CAAX farnesyltransferase (FTase) subunit beta [Saxophila tyrrhenica]